MESSCSDTGTESPVIQKSRSSSGAPSSIPEQSVQQPGMPAQGTPKLLAPKPPQTMHLQAVYQNVAYHNPPILVHVAPQMGIQGIQAIQHQQQIYRPAQALPTQRVQGHQAAQAVLHPVPNGQQVEREEQEENDNSEMPRLAPEDQGTENVAQDDQYSVENESVDSDEGFSQKMFVNEAITFRNFNGRTVHHDIDNIDIEESDRPFTTKEREAIRQREEHDNTPEDTSFEEEPTSTRRRRGAGVGSRGGRGRGGRSRGRGRGGRNRRVQRFEEEEEPDDFEAEEAAMEQRLEPMEQHIEPQQEPAPMVEEEPVEEKEETPASVGKKQRRKRNQIEMLEEGFDAPAFGTPAKGGRRRSTIEARPKETLEPRMTRQKRKEQEFGDMEMESPAAKKTPPATPDQEPVNEESPASIPSGKPDVCRHCEKAITVSSQYPQYCSQACRRNYLEGQEAHMPVEEEEEEEEEKEIPPAAEDFYNDETMVMEEEQAPAQFEQELYEADRLRNIDNVRVVVAAPPAQVEEEVVAPNLRAALEPTPSPPAIDFQQEEEEEEEIEEEVEQEQEYVPEEEGLPEQELPPYILQNYDDKAPQYWTLQYTADKLTEYMKKDQNRMFVDNQIDGYCLWTGNKTLIKACKIPFGHVLTVFKGFNHDEELQDYPKHNEDCPPAYDATGLHNAQSVREWVAQFTNSVVADELYMCDLDAVAISHMTMEDLMDCTTALKMGYANKISHILQENKKVGVVYELNTGDNLPMKIRENLAGCFQLCMGNELVKDMLTDYGIDADILYHLTMTDLVKGLDLKYGIAKRLSLLIEKATAEGGKSSEAMMAYHGPSTLPNTPEEVLSIFEHILSPVEKAKFQNAKIRGDMMEHLTPDDLVKIGFRYGSAKKVCVLIDKFTHDYAWAYETLRPESEEFMATAVNFKETQVYEWISKICDADTAGKLKDKEIDGPLLSCLNPHLLTKYLNITFDKALTICVKMKNLPLLTEQKVIMANDNFYQKIADATSLEVVEKIKEMKLGTGNFIVVTFDDLAERFKFGFTTALKIIRCIRTVYLPHVIRMMPEVQPMAEWSSESVYNWAVELVGMQQAEQIRQEDLDGDAFVFASFEDCLLMGFCFGPARVLHSNMIFWKRR